MIYYEASRLRLRDWKEADLEPFCQLNANEQVMKYFPKTLSIEETNNFYKSIESEFIECGFGLYAVEVKENEDLIGFIWFHRATFEADFTPCLEIGWRLKKEAWGFSYKRKRLERRITVLRSEQEMMNILIDFAKNEDRIRLATLEGSRTNKNIQPDTFQDYDISYFVTELDPFKKNDQWLRVFGNRVMMQKPEDMELFPPEMGNWFSYLMLFEDGTKVDLTLIPLNEVEDYFAKSDGLVEVLLDKDTLIKNEVIATDRQYWIKKPTPREFDDCCNEFWMVSTYVVKGLARKEILFAIDHLNEIARPNLLRMMAWKIGSEQGYTFSVGKNYKFINRYLPNEDWKKLLSTYSENGYQKMWQSLLTCCELFRTYSKAVSESLEYKYPDYDEAITKYNKIIT